MATVRELEARVKKIEERLKRLEAAVNEKPKIGLTIDEANEFLSKPIKRTEEDIKRALSIVGLANGGPPDLAENCRHYL